MIVNDETVADQWEAWARHATALARRLEDAGDSFDASLKAARADAYRSAAEQLRGNTGDPGSVAGVLMRCAAQTQVRTPPLIGFDQAAVNYTRARTWQRCARELDPTLDEVQPRWSER